MICEVIGSGPPYVTWYRDGDRIHVFDGGRVDIGNEVTGNTTTSTLRIQSIELSDRGVYRCQAEDNDGANATETILDVKGNGEEIFCCNDVLSKLTLLHHILLVSSPPSVVPATITSPPQSVTASTNGTASFTCMAEGFDLPTISWGRSRNSSQLDTLTMGMMGGKSG